MAAARGRWPTSMERLYVTILCLSIWWTIAFGLRRERAGLSCRTLLATATVVIPRSMVMLRTVSLNRSLVVTGHAADVRTGQTGAVLEAWIFAGMAGWRPAPATQA